LKVTGFIIVILTGTLLLYATGDFPDWGDPRSPASTHVSPRYIERALEETAVPNVVTAVLADYRGFDTMFETTVIFCAGVACFLLLRVFSRGPEEKYYRHIPTGVIIHGPKEVVIPEDSQEFERIDTLWIPYDVIIRTVCRMLIPFIQLFALYVIAHGHHSPGGGFQGGVILGASVILMAISSDLRSTLARLSETRDGILCAAGVLVYAGVGAVCMVSGSSFLDYGALAAFLPLDPVQARSLGILVVEIGVGLAVMGVMVCIYGNIASAGRLDEGL
jgi:multicomponent Na+:H+ antiporter subunit B